MNPYVTHEQQAARNKRFKAEKEELVRKIQTAAREVTELGGGKIRITIDMKEVKK